MGGSKDLSQQLDQIRNQLSDLQTQVGNSSKKCNKQPATISGLACVTTDSPSVNRDIDNLQKTVFSLEAQLTALTGQVNQMNTNVISLSGSMESVLATLTELKTNKAELSHVESMVGDKASQRALDFKVDRPYFDNAIRDLVQQYESLSSRIDDITRELDEKLVGVFSSMQSKMDKTELDPFKTQLEGRLKALKKLLEITKSEEASAGGVDPDAMFRKPMIGYQSVAYDSQQFGQTPHASIPTAGALPHMDTIRPYTTFDMHSIRQQSQFNRTAMDERDFLRSRKNNEYGYRRKVAGSMNYAFNAYEQGAMSNYENAIPCHGGSSIPPNYAIPKLGRSCGGIYTMTTPHRRFTKVKIGPNDQYMDEDEMPGHQAQSLESKIQQQFNNPQEEVELCGHDGHIYKGRTNQTEAYQSSSNHQANSETDRIDT